MSAARPRVLVLAPFPPSPFAPHGGSRAIAHLILGLAAGADVAVAHMREPDEPEVDASVATVCDTVLELHRASPARGASAGWARRGRLATGLLRSRTMWASDYLPSRRSRNDLTQLIRGWRPSVLQVEFTVMTPYARPFTDPIVRVLTDHDPSYQSSANRTLRRIGVSRVLVALDARAWRKLQHVAIQSVDAVVTFTSEDRQAIGRIAPEARVEVIPLTVPIPSMALDPLGQGPNVVFVGNLIHEPNRDAALWLGHEILPLVRARMPAARLQLIGNDPDGTMRTKFRGDPAIEVTGLVPDVTPYLDRAAVVIAPIRLGGGMRVKVLEALAAGKAVVATPRGAAGLSPETAGQLALGTTANELAEATISVLENPDTRRGLAIRARQWAEREFRPELRAEAYLRLYGELLARSDNAQLPGAPRRPAGVSS